jgi:hypothetical protein
LYLLVEVLAICSISTDLACLEIKRGYIDYYKH